MKKITLVLILGLIIGLLRFCSTKAVENNIEESLLITYAVNPIKQNLQFFWKNKEGRSYLNFESLKLDLKRQKKDLVFAMNGGMYNKDLSPQGLYIEKGKTYAELDTTKEGYGNFYLQPNGIFYLTEENQAVICTTQYFVKKENIKYATQSGPMLIIKGEIHSKFTKGSNNLHIRNGVGVLPNGNVLFAMSKEKINFYDFAFYFKQKGCKNALYLDGFVSKTYLPSKNWMQKQGKFGVIIGEVVKE